MNMNKIRNVISLRTRNLSKRIQRALEELSDVLANDQPAPVPIPVRIPVRRGPNLGSSRRFSTLYGASGTDAVAHDCTFHIKRCFSSFANAYNMRPESFFRFNHFTNLNNFRGDQFFGKYKWFFKFYKSSRFFHSRCAGSANEMFRSCLQRNGNGFMYNHFSQSQQNPFRWKLYSKNLKLSYRNIICQIKDKYTDLDNQNQSNKNLSEESVLHTIAKYDLATRLSTFTESHGIRLNMSLTPKHHKLTLDLARTESSASGEEVAMYDQVHRGSYIEFPINFNFSIPDETILNDEVLDELLVSVKRFQNRLAEFKSDIVCLFELGELPIKYIKDRQVLRVYFPNCDYNKLEMLCREKNVTGGIIYEDFGEETVVKKSSAPDVIYADPVSVSTAADRNSANHNTDMSASTSGSTVVSSEDILSSSLYESDDSLSSSYSFDEDDVLSQSMIHPLANEEIVRIDYAASQPTQVSIHSGGFDDYYWVAA